MRGRLGVRGPFCRCAAFYPATSASLGVCSLNAGAAYVLALMDDTTPPSLAELLKAKGGLCSGLF